MIDQCTLFTPINSFWHEAIEVNFSNLKPAKTTRNKLFIIRNLNVQKLLKYVFLKVMRILNHLKMSDIDNELIITMF